MAIGPGAVVDRYVLDTVIGRGGMAVVYRAHHAQLGTPVAIKILMVPDATVRQRLVQEGRIQASLVHPHVVRVFDVIQVGDLPGLVMEWVDGPTLAAVVSRYKLSLEQVDDLARALLDGVGAAHARGLVHRDLKPGNVLLEVGPRGVVPKVADFGLAKLVEGSAEDRLVQTSTGALMGTPAYMSPEQIRDTRNVDTRTDIFSLGVILYELACGRRPFDQGDVIQLFSAIDAGKYPPPRSLRPDLPEGVERAIVGALQSDRGARIPDCATLLATWRGGGDSAVPRSPTGPWPPEQMALLRAAGAPVARAAPPSTASEAALPTPFAAPSAGEAQPSPAPGSETQDWASSPSLSASPTSGPGAPLASPGVAAPAGAAPETPVRVLSTAGLAWRAPALVGVALAGVAAGGWWITRGEPAPALATAATADATSTSTSTSMPTSTMTSIPTSTTTSTSTSPSSAITTATGSVRAPSVEPRAPSVESRAASGQSRAPSPELRVPSAEVPSAETAPVALPPAVTADPPSPDPIVTAPPGPPAGKARVSLSGDVSSAWLVGAGGNFRLPSDVPAGTYELRVYFSPDTATTVSTLTLAEGQSRTIRCALGARQCK